jgi:adenosylcobinamide hydrolase
MTNCTETVLPEKTRLMIPSGETIENTGDALILRFRKRRSVLSTSWLNGGFCEDLSAVFNHQIPPAACDDCHANGGVKSYLEGVAKALALDPAAACGLITRGEMRNAAMVSARYLDLTVTAVVTAGIDKNGVRAGDPASYHESDGRFEPVGGTINTILVIGASLPEYALIRAVMTATEAKAAALQQLMARSIYSAGIATGSGTDMIVIIANPDASLHLTDASTHAMLGELIAKTVIRATTLALERETGLSPESQRDVLVRLSRFGVSEEDMFNAAAEEGFSHNSGMAGKEQFVKYLRTWAQRPENVARTAAALHLVDEAGWDLLSQETARDIILRIMRGMEDDRSTSVHTLAACLTTLLPRLVARDMDVSLDKNRNDRGSGTSRPAERRS